MRCAGWIRDEMADRVAKDPLLFHPILPVMINTPFLCKCPKKTHLNRNPLDTAVECF